MIRVHFSNLVNKFPAWQLAIVGVLVVVGLLTPAVAFAWGPDRQTFTQQSPSDHVTFNSITNNPKWGDERNFMRIRDLSTNATFGDSANLVAGRKYEVIILYHNNASSSLNAGGTGIANGAYARTEIPALVRNGQSNIKAMSYVGASNSTPASVYDHIDLSNSTTADIALRYVPGTAKITSNGAINGQLIPDNLFAASGTPIGFDSLNGKLPGCDHYSGYITFTLVADAPGFSFAKDVRLAGTKDWNDKITAAPGDKLEYRLSYKNTGTTEQKNVVMKDVLPKGIKYTAGQTDLVNSLAPNGKRLGDGINGDGVNIGDYAAGANAYLYIMATVDSAEPCATLTNTASVETSNGNRQDNATVLVSGECALPTTGPVEIIAGFVGLAAITFGVVYYLRSRRELEDKLMDAQTHATTVTHASETDDAADDDAKSDDNEPLTKHIEHHKKHDN